MSELKTIRVGDRVTQYPALTHNALIAGELARRGSPLAIDDTRQPKQKSPVIARLVWSGDEPLEPGRVVKIVDALFDPGTDEWAPFHGLSFNVAAFESGDSGEPYAITMGPIAAALFDHADPPSPVTKGVGYGVLPECYWAKVNVSDVAHTHAKLPTTGTLLASGMSGLKIIWKESSTGEKWAVVLIGAGGGSTATMMVLTEAIAAATGDTATITPAEALAQPYSTDSSGVRTPSGDPVTIRNYDTCQGYTSGTQVWVAGVDVDFPEILSAACCELSEPA